MAQTVKNLPAIQETCPISGSGRSLEHLESCLLMDVDLNTGEPVVAEDVDIWDNYFV